ncbi:hypothetical protein CCMA1212_002621 [Trichoderma ghanense]|uniref:Uncharacterized protein n=1 Tax=Trichoderma ghanense TaxID=65468 RepID=A0ABY2HBI9_9HYPO
MASGIWRLRTLQMYVKAAIIVHVLIDTFIFYPIDRIQINVKRHCTWTYFIDSNITGRPFANYHVFFFSFSSPRASPQPLVGTTLGPLSILLLILHPSFPPSTVRPLNLHPANYFAGRW